MDTEGSASEKRGSNADALRYYARQSSMTDAGRWAGWLTDLPRDIAALQRVANGLAIHFRLDDPLAVGISEERLAEVDSRYAEKIFARLHELDGRPLTERRLPRHRMVGCCRDFTVIFLAMARSLDIPARARVGFATYFFPNVKNDHEVAEVWDDRQQRWRLVDAQLGDEHVDPNDGTRIEPADVPRDRFLAAGSAWHLCKAGEADPDTFVVRPDIDVAITRGWPYISHNVVFDLAALNKMELLLWDLWGLAGKVLHGKSPMPSEQATLERVAEAVGCDDPDFTELRTLYENEPLLKVPDKVMSLSPAGMGPREVALR